MRAMVWQEDRVAIEEIATPVPGPGEVLARVRAGGICATDVHVFRHRRRPPGERAVMGHEFVAEVVKAGPGAEGWPPGTRVASMPLLLREGAPNGALMIGGTPAAPGGYGEYVLLSNELLLPVPEGLSDEVAALTEPCAVALHAVRAAALAEGEGVLVMGAGPIGLMVLLWLKKLHRGPVIVTNRSRARAGLAGELGADAVFDPGQPDLREEMARVIGPVAPGPQPGGRAITLPMAIPMPGVVFECAGAPGAIQEAMRLVRPLGQVIALGVLDEEDRILPGMGIRKEVTVRFVNGYDEAEYAEALTALGDGTIAPGKLVTRRVALEDVPGIFRGERDAADCKVVWMPGAG